MTEYDRIVRGQMALERLSDVDLEILDCCFEAGYDAGRWGIAHVSLSHLVPLPAPADCVRSRENGYALGVMDRLRGEAQLAGAGRP